MTEQTISLERLEVTLTAECREEICAEQPGRPLPPSGEATSPS